MVNFSNLYSTVVAKIEAQGLSCNVTLHSLVLGAEDAGTKHYAKGYTDSTIKMVAMDTQGEFNAVLGTGSHVQLTQTVSVAPDTAIAEGDGVTDSFGSVWVVKSVLPFPAGNVMVHKRVELFLNPDSSYTHPEPVVPTPTGLAVADPLPLIVDLEHWLDVDNTTIITLPLINWLDVDEATVISIATAVTLDITGNIWLLDCAYNTYGTLNPTGLQQVTDGNTQAVTATADTANGYVINSATPFALDDLTYHHGSVDAAGTASYTVPDQTQNTFHQLRCSFSVGWGGFGTVCTPTGYSKVASGSTKVYTAAGSAGVGFHWHIWLDGATDLGHSPATVPAQTDGTYHEITQVVTPN